MAVSLRRGRLVFPKPANGFEDRGAIVRYRPSACIQVRMQASPIRHRPQ